MVAEKGKSRLHLKKQIYQIKTNLQNFKQIYKRLKNVQVPKQIDMVKALLPIVKTNLQVANYTERVGTICRKCLLLIFCVNQTVSLGGG